VVVNQPERILAAEGRVTGREFVKRYAQGVEIATIVERLSGSAGLLRGEIGQLAGNLPMRDETPPIFAKVVAKSKPARNSI
jgi:hypothetical protein